MDLEEQEKYFPGITLSEKTNSEVYRSMKEKLQEEIEKIISQGLTCGKLTIGTSTRSVDTVLTKTLILKVLSPNRRAQV